MTFKKRMLFNLLLKLIVWRNFLSVKRFYIKHIHIQDGPFQESSQISEHPH